MNILLVRPAPHPETIGLQHVMIVEPLELEMLGAIAVKRGHTVCIADMIVEKRSLSDILTSFKPDIFAVTGYITSVPEMIDACSLAKRLIPSVVTAVGGVHCEVCPEDFNHPCVDWRFVRNGLTGFESLILCMEENKHTCDTPYSGMLPYGETADFSQFEPIDFHYVPPERTLTAQHRHRYFYIFHNKVALIKTSFGCPFSCEFCFCRRITGGVYHERPLDDVILELASISEREIYIVDDDFLVNRRRVESFLDAVEKNNIQKNYLLYGRADFIAENPDLMRRFASLGLRTVIVGIESFSDDELKKYNKGTSASLNEHALAVLRSCGIDCFATVILGIDWTVADFDLLTKKLIELKVRYVNLQPYTPLPGSPPSSQTAVVDDSRLLYRRDDYHCWDLAHVTVRPGNMTVAEYYRQIIRAYRRVLFQPRIIINYFLTYSPRLLLKMLIGSYRIQKQYRQKMKEAQNYAKDTTHPANPV